MPELPEVEAVCRKLRRDALGLKIVRLRLLRHPDMRLERAVRGRTIARIDRRGKNILLRLDKLYVLRVHLRMTGNLYVIPDARLRANTVRAYFVLEGGSGLVLDDPRALGRINLLGLDDATALDNELGAEPLSDNFTADGFVTAARSSARPSKLYLMDQNRIAGLGNIYAAEALHRARVHPAKPMNRLSRQKLSALHSTIVETLRAAVESACRAYAGPGKFEASETFNLSVYGREGEACPRCARQIRRIVQGGRSTYYCPGCQR